MKKEAISQKRGICFYLLIVLILLVIGCSKSPSKDNAGQEASAITGSVVAEANENCRFANESDCSPIVIRRGEPESEENNTEAASAAVTLNNTVNLSEEIELSNCEEGWKCVEKNYRAYQYANCSWISIEHCIYGCNESICRSAPICKVNSLKCENDNLMICGEEGYGWLLNKSCDKACENDICTEDLPVNATLDMTANISNNITQNNFMADNCMSVSKYNLTGKNATDEYFTLKNSCSYQIDMGSWTVNDDTSHVFTFSNFNLASNGEVTVITGSGTNSTTALYWGRGSAVWNNNGDTLYLNVPNGTNILTKALTP